jgi:hypothetical protein
MDNKYYVEVKYKRGEYWEQYGEYHTTGQAEVVVESLYSKYRYIRIITR